MQHMKRYIRLRCFAAVGFDTSQAVKQNTEIHPMLYGMDFVHKQAFWQK